MSPATTPRTSSELPQYPPPAHTSPRAPITEQPTPAPTMSTSRKISVEEGKAARLRGGCIPCPDGGCCFIIPCCC
ncbi:hypothetical protein C8F04DRAFT_179810 [Mycena alexandri]|uniref:Uncharacterized protein n=1 Tax=Mycena alexandri TaxID=1745969 RepID=A0AAD6S9V1_9AGAR|nr:hypothetical protein C8F04DRAFT_179810 [Mycena alexandri]